ncbi:MAG: 8-amino-7-oxononanoate synthase [Gammaproteobacteria bacterium]|nr:8-amino-7-oxononanoate synthase [Gammaproteobacteria bacterium]
MKDLKKLLQQKKEAGLYRQRRITQGPQSTELIVDDKKVINFCSNNYLGLANHPTINQAFKQGIDRYGSGSASAHLINGHSAAHHALEEELAEFTGYQRCLLFSTGYMANIGVVQALMGRGDVVLEDRLNHASLLDAGLLSGARFSRFEHASVSDARSKLSKYPEQEKMLLTDGVFSMDGDIAPLAELAQVCQQHQSYLMVDDAHGIGVLGEQGRGSLEYLGLAPSAVPVLMATLGKAFGAAGAFVAGSEDVIEYLIQNARSYIYTTAMPAALAEASRASLKLVQAENARRQKLVELIKQFRRAVAEMGYQLMDSVTPIQPIVIGDSKKALEMSQQLFAQGIHVSAIRPPTVEQGKARLRITFNADHSFGQLQQLLDALDVISKKNTLL